MAVGDEDAGEGDKLADEAGGVVSVVGKYGSHEMEKAYMGFMRAATMDEGAYAAIA